MRRAGRICAAACWRTACARSSAGCGSSASRTREADIDEALDTRRAQLCAARRASGRHLTRAARPLRRAFHETHTFLDGTTGLRDFADSRVVRRCCDAKATVHRSGRAGIRRASLAGTWCRRWISAPRRARWWRTRWWKHSGRKLSAHCGARRSTPSISCCTARWSRQSLADVEGEILARLRAAHRSRRTHLRRLRSACQLHTAHGRTAPTASSRYRENPHTDARAAAQIAAEPAAAPLDHEARCRACSGIIRP